MQGHEMVEELRDSKNGELGLSNPENNIENCDKQRPIAPKKTVLRDLQNEQRHNMPESTSVFLKDRTSIADATKVESGTKRLRSECPTSPSCDQSPTGNAVNGRLVYVRRKVEGDTGKNSTSNNVNLGIDSQVKTQIKGQGASCFQAVAPLPMAVMSSSAKPTVSLSLGVSGVRSTQPGSNSDRLDWEERYHRLQMFLKKLDESDQKDYVQMLRSLSSVELSRHAVELEKRSIQLSLEEAKEVQRVAALNVLGRSMNSFKAPSPAKD